MAPDIEQKIKDYIEKNSIALFMKGDAASPMCGFSAAVVQILQHMDVEFKDINVLEYPDIREGIKDFSDWPTIPQLYVQGDFIGGCDIIREMHMNGELNKLFEEKGIKQSTTAA